MTEQNGLELSNATDELRRMLDERGVEYTKTIVTEGTLFTIVTSKEHYFILMRDNDAGIEMWSQYFTPEQAIAATLGRGECHDTGESRVFHCSECGFGIEDAYVEDEHAYPTEGFPKFCPWCGAEVVRK